jgi:hypothetical protein
VDHLFELGVDPSAEGLHHGGDTTADNWAGFPRVFMHLGQLIEVWELEVVRLLDLTFLVARTTELLSEEYA